MSKKQIVISLLLFIVLVAVILFCYRFFVSKSLKNENEVAKRLDSIDKKIDGQNNGADADNIATDLIANIIANCLGKVGQSIDGYSDAPIQAGNDAPIQDLNDVGEDALISEISDVATNAIDETIVDE